jgi:signal transduction histidine kinase
MRARNRNFNADFELDLDPDVPKIKIVSQDIGRVLLNLINNAFQALSADNGKRITENGKVTLTTKNQGDKIEITISDNGPGIPDDIKDKIFQPFFTTKPTGQGTGLGLSLSYDIVKAHGGEIRLQQNPIRGSIFIISLPIQP